MKKTARRLAAAAICVCLILALNVTVFAAAVTKEDAIQTALKDAGLKKTEVTGLKAVKDGKEYEIRFREKKTGNRYEYEVSVRTGEIREAETEFAHAFNRSKAKVGKAKAIAAAAKISGIKKSIVEKGSCRYQKDDGEWIYKLKFRTKGCTYEVEVLAPTGKVTEYSREYK